MTKRLIDIDDELLSAAREASGRDTIKGTVNTALEHLVAANRRREGDIRQRWTELGVLLEDLQDEEVMRQAWS